VKIKMLENELNIINEIELAKGRKNNKNKIYNQRK